MNKRIKRHKEGEYKMAINYSVYDAIKTIKDGKDVEVIIDIAKRYPMLAVLANSIDESAMKMFEAFPEYITARKINSALSEGVQKSKEADTDTDEDEDEAPKKKRGRPAKKSKPVEDDDEDEDDEEDDDEDEKPSKKSKAKKGKKSKKPVEDEDDDDEFDFD